MNDDLMLLRIIHSRKFLISFGKFKMNFITKVFLFNTKVVY
jgi:hypothetical protein